MECAEFYLQKRKKKLNKNKSDLNQNNNIVTFNFWISFL